MPVDTIVAQRTKTRTAWLRRWLEGSGAAILLASDSLWGELSATHTYTYHHLLPLKTVDRALALDLIVFSVLAMLTTRAIEWLVTSEEPRPGRRPLTPLLWAFWISFLVAVGVLALIQSEILRWQYLSARAVFALSLAILFVVWAGFSTIYDVVVRRIRSVLLVFGVCIFWMVPTLLASSFVRQPYDRTDFVKPIAQHDNAHPRIVWLIFDGMSYDQLFVHRWPDLQMPNFDQLRARSVVFSGVSPAGSYTEDILPSLLLGKPIAHLRGTRSGWPIYQADKDSPWVPFDGDQTIFADAKRNGWTTGVVGIWNPYCRILENQLDFCHSDLPGTSNMSRDQNTLQNSLAPLREFWTLLAVDQDRKPDPKPTTFADLGFVQKDNLMLRDSRIDFCLLHLPAPHAPGMYDRKTHRIEWGPAHSYVDSMAFSDLLLGNILGQIDASGAADRTTLIVSSDHSWRVWLWRHNIGWTDEDEIASEHGKFDDPRPVLMVRFPHEQHASEISRPVPLLWMHGLIESMMAGQIESRQQLEDWAARQ